MTKSIGGKIIRKESLKKEGRPKDLKEKPKSPPTPEYRKGPKQPKK
jgi:hypothetical protein